MRWIFVPARRIPLLSLLLLGACNNPHEPAPAAGSIELLTMSTGDDWLRHVFDLRRRPLERSIDGPTGVALNGRWSPDGKRIVFVREMGTFAGNEGRIVGQISAMNADGSHAVRLTNRRCRSERS
jgi:hypothetical protein